MSKDKVDIQVDRHSEVDKFFRIIIGNELCLEVDYDDVNHPYVDAMTDTMVEVLRNHWSGELLKQNLRKYFLKQYNENTDLQEEYPNFEDYLNEHS